MKVTQCELPGLMIIEPKVFDDERGYFLETWNRRRYAEAGVDVDFQQSNVSLSVRDTLRGLHFQNPSPQGKLVYVLEGEVYDVAVDIRRDSPTFRRWFGLTLSGESKAQLYVPPGFAHGFCVTSERALFAYHCTTPYKEASDQVLAWNDPELAIHWPVREPLLSAKDAAAPTLGEIPVERLPGPAQP